MAAAETSSESSPSSVCSSTPGQVRVRVRVRVRLGLESLGGQLVK